MKVDGPQHTQKASQAKKKGKAESGDGSFGSLVSGATGESGAAGAAQSIAKVDSLLAVQGAEDPTERAAQKRMRQRADNVLDELDRLRMRLLSGTLTVGDVVGIASVVAAHRERVMDPQLTALLDEVDLRAQIELAKMRVAMDKI